MVGQDVFPTDYFDFSLTWLAVASRRKAGNGPVCIKVAPTERLVK
jgi:hypothetical protein